LKAKKNKDRNNITKGKGLFELTKKMVKLRPSRITNFRKEDGSLDEESVLKHSERLWQIQREKKANQK